jgi:hypothetical protein
MEDAGSVDVERVGAGIDETPKYGEPAGAAERRGSR